MRRLIDGNKRVISIFSIIIIGIIAILVLFIVFSFFNTKEEYYVSSGAIAYDMEYDQIKIDSEGRIEKKWDGNYYLYDNEDNKYNLGSQAIVYDVNKSTLNVFGNIYKVLSDGQVEKYTGNNKISNLNDDFIYKLADRKYVITGGRIINQNNSLNTEDFLIAVLDKSGNTLLTNNVLNAKTINPMTIYTASFGFDVANEKLVYENQDIDLKKIIGSTNNYVEKEEPIGQEEIVAEENDKEGSGGNEGGDNIAANGQNATINSTENTINADLNVTNNNSSGGLSSKDVIKKSTLSKYIEVRNVTVGASYIDINYIINDPENKYQVVSVTVESTNNFQRTISLDKNVTSYRIADLNPDTQYQLTFGYNEILAGNSVSSVVHSVQTVKTKKVNADLQITRLTFSKIYFTLKLDTDYVFSSGKLAVYVDKRKTEEVNIDIEEAKKSKGWSSSVKYESGTEYILRLENLKYNDKSIDYVIESKFKKY